MRFPWQDEPTSIIKTIALTVGTAALTGAGLSLGARLVGGVPTYPTDGGFWARRKAEQQAAEKAKKAAGTV